MADLPEFSRKEPSTGTLLQQSRERSDNIKENLSNPSTEPTAGVSNDQGRAPVQQDLGKGSVQRAQVDGGGSARTVDHIGNWSGANINRAELCFAHLQRLLLPFEL
ncbi:predicted protein [Aspergillus terreus NIH2624]|uniref:Uncharacterized protein n=1 Tax=Aspergillus terreus (strain NIH 2624 / FGSC A1156) TaxID=341663 RepID=Q0CYP0_ASPTN|nr:uncharacterized protein ATEG_01194 [Aspergillus terreus NIH2624]EAU37951.1 predicted protein [Aspergillus terreus NIH2624]